MYITWNKFSRKFTAKLGVSECHMEKFSRSFKAKFVFLSITIVSFNFNCTPNKVWLKIFYICGMSLLQIFHLYQHICTFPQKSKPSDRNMLLVDKVLYLF